MQRIEGDGRLRSAKDLGRVLALARLTGIDDLERWAKFWSDGLRQCFPNEWRALAVHAGSGLRELLASDIPMEQACQFNESGLLSGKAVSTDMLRETGRRIIQLVLEPLRLAAGD